MKAYAYLRVSSDSQLEGAGLDRQREAIRAWADSTGTEIIRWFEEAHTGTEADRPGFASMLAEINGCRIIVVESLDRLARDLMIQSLLLSRLAAAGVELYAANTGENVTEAVKNDPMRKAMVQIQGVFAELDKNLLVRKLRKAKEKLRKEGHRTEGPPPYGAKPGEREVIEKIKAMRPLSYQKIANSLNAEGIPGRYGGKWTAPQICLILKRERQNAD